MTDKSHDENNSGLEKQIEQMQKEKELLKTENNRMANK